jgi:methyl-accepting chemotaxis protein
MFLSSVKTRPRILLAVTVPLVLMIALGISAIVNIQRITKTSEWVEHTYDVLGGADELLAAAVDMETGMRGFLLAGDEAFLAPYTEGEKRFRGLLSSLLETVSDNPGQVERLEVMDDILDQWRSDVAEPMIAMRREIGHAKTMTDVGRETRRGQGKVFFDGFREQVATFIATEEKTLHDHRMAFDRLSRAPMIDADQFRRAIEAMAASTEIIGRAKDLMIAALDMETGMRGYLLAGTDAFLGPYDAGRERFLTLHAALKAAVADNPDQSAVLDGIMDAIEGWRVDVVEPMIALRRSIGDAKTMDDLSRLVGEARGKVFFDAFRSTVTAFTGAESNLMALRKAENANTVSLAWVMVVGGIGLAVVLGGGLGLGIGDGIAKPIIAMTEAMRRLAGGDKAVEIPGVERVDEVGAMAAAVQVFKENMIKAEQLTARELEAARVREAHARRLEILTRDFDASVGDLLGGVSMSAQGMERTAGGMTSVAEDTRGRATTVSVAAEQASNNVQTVATATEELAASIQEIARQVTRSSDVAARAVEEARRTDQQVQGLARAATRIGEVIGLITDVASQTNLLALNATIEAARAGEAGKGFAVVAGEVKGLANQTARATDEIAHQIAAIQQETRDAVDAIQAIVATINESSSIASAIASAVDEQQAATQEIARNVEQAAVGTQQVTSNIQEVTQSAGQTGEAAGEVARAANDMGTRANELRRQVEKFLEDVRAA